EAVAGAGGGEELGAARQALDHRGAGFVHVAVEALRSAGCSIGRDLLEAVAAAVVLAAEGHGRALAGARRPASLPSRAAGASCAAISRGPRACAAVRRITLGQGRRPVVDTAAERH